MKEKIYEALYNGSVCESAAHTISIHKTPEGAEKAIEEHKEWTKREWEKLYEDDEDEDREEFPWDFDQWWGIRETELLD